VKWLTPHPDSLDQATSSFSVDLRDFGSSAHLSHAKDRRRPSHALRPQPKPSANPPESTSTLSDDATGLMEANEKEIESFQKRVFRIPLEKPFEESYFTSKSWMFFRETKETEEDFRRMFCEAREKMKNKITLKKKSDRGKFAIPCTVKGIEFPLIPLKLP
ncbi:hypothetical protein IGI04_007312, partial [Brassica rapa subsp. trilocularis]